MTLLTRRVLIAAMLATPAVVRAQAWPARPVRLVVPFGAGSSPDLLARRFAERAGASLGQPVVVENRSGAGGVIGADLVAKAVPDGHVLGISNGGPHVVAPIVRTDLPYRAADFAHLGMLGSFPLALVVRADGPVRDLPGFIAMARGKPGGPSVGSPGTAGAPHFTLELMKLQHGLEFLHVPFRGGGQMAAEIAGGRLDGGLAAFADFATNDRLRIIAISSAERLPGWPAIPTMREQGLDIVVPVWFGLCAPAGLPDAIAHRLSHEAFVAASSPEMAALLGRLGGLAQPMDRATMTALVAAETARWTEVARAVDMTPG